MKHITLSYFSISNFGPFADEVKLSTLTDSSKKEFLEDNTFEDNDNNFNKVIYIYGANSTGKSSFCKGLLKLKQILAFSALLTSNNQEIHQLPIFEELKASRNYFKFSNNYFDKPTIFTIELLINEICYNYSLSIADEGIIIKEILTRKKKRTEIIFERLSPSFKDIELRSEFKSLSTKIDTVKENVPFLSMADVLNNELAQTIMRGILDIQVINMPAMTGLRNVTPDTFNADRLNRYLEILKIADPTLESITVSFEEKEVEKRFKIEDFENREVIISSINAKVDSYHSAQDNNNISDLIKLPFLEIESNGTIKILNMLPIIYNSLENGSPLVIDEIDSGIHPNLLNMIIELFYNNESNPYNAQLICTSHSTEIIEQKNIRRDQIWFFHKEINHAGSEIRRLSDFYGIRLTDNIVKKYLEGAFGGIPQINSL